MGYADTVCSITNSNSGLKIKELEKTYLHSSEIFKKECIEKFIMDCIRNISENAVENFDDDEKKEEKIYENDTNLVVKSVNGFNDDLKEKDNQVKLTLAISFETIRPDEFIVPTDWNEHSIQNGVKDEPANDNLNNHFESVSEKSVNEQKINGSEHVVLSDSNTHGNLVQNLVSSDEKSCKANDGIEHDSSNEIEFSTKTSEGNTNARDVSNIENQKIVNEQIDAIDQTILQINKVADELQNDESIKDTLLDGRILKEIEQISDAYSYSLTRIKKVSYRLKLLISEIIIRIFFILISNEG